MNTHFHYIYEITHTETGRIYVGQHTTTDLADGYMGSGIRITKALNKYGRDAFTKKIIAFLPNQYWLNKVEALLVNQRFADREDTFNIREGGGAKGKHSESTKQLMSNSAKGKPKTQAHRAKLAAASTGVRQSEETIKKRVSKCLGLKRNKQARENISNGRRNGAATPVFLSEEAREKKRASKNRWAERNQDEVKAYSRAYRENNKDYFKAYREAHKDQLREKGRLHYQKNKEAIAAKSAARYKRKKAERLANKQTSD